MKIEEMQKAWNDTNKKLESCQEINSADLDQLDRRRILSPLKKITASEKAGAFTCIAGSVVLVTNFNKLDSIVFQITGILAIVLLLLVPLISFLSLKLLNRQGDMDKPHADFLKHFAVAKLNFFRFQKLSVLLSFLLFVAVIMLLPKIFGGKDITAYKNFWLYGMPAGFIFLLCFSQWVNKKYRGAINKTETLLRSLNEM